MKKIISLTIQAVLLAVPASSALAVIAAPNIDFLGALNAITNWLFSILLIVAAIFIIIAGYYFVTASGDPEKTSKARNFVLWALIGVLVGFLAKGLVILVGVILGYNVG
jgi:hypothetical protein